MADALPFTTPHYMQELLTKLQQHTITLDECYALHRWLKAAHLGTPPPGLDASLLACYVLTLVEARIIDLQGHAPC